MTVHTGTEEDLPWFWAAYRKDGFDPGRFPKGLSQGDFLIRLARFLGDAPRLDIIVGMVREKRIPLGVVIASTNGYHVFPVVTWFPWASDRNRLEGAVHWLNEVRRSHVGAFTVTLPERGFFDHLCEHYGVLHRVGQVPNWYGEHDAMYYVTRRVKV